MPTAVALPRWDMESVFPSLDSAEYIAAMNDLRSKLASLESDFDALGIGVGASQAGVADFERLAHALNEVLDLSSLLITYTFGTLDTDSRNARAQARASELDLALVPLNKIKTRLTAWLGTIDVDKFLAESSVARSLEYAIRKAQVEASKLMDPALEALAADLAVTGSTAWAKMHGDLTSQIEADVNGEKLPMSSIRNLAYDASRDVRASAYRAELEAWKAWELPIAASMNGVKGEVSLLCRRRGWESPLDEALFNANIDRATLDAMLGAARASFPVFRRYMKAKAKALGVQQLEWYDLFAPVGQTTQSWAYADACDFVAARFDGYSKKMGDFARRSFAENWIDVESRPGKRDGAYCADLRADESRILMNFKPAFGSLKTLAHELGHAYHNLCLHGRTALQKNTPMTLAETASTFCETIVAQAALKTTTGQDRLAILEGSLMGACQVVVDITSRFQFESAVFGSRDERELSGEEFCGHMEQAQKDTYGDGLASYHPYMWAAKPHYYSTGSFYNFPYMFGLLFGLGLYAQYEQEPDAFRAKYDDLLSSTGLADAATLAARFGIDIRSGAFWEGSLGVIGRDIELFEQSV